MTKKNPAVKNEHVRMASQSDARAFPWKMDENYMSNRTTTKTFNLKLKIFKIFWEDIRTNLLTDFPQSSSLTMKARTAALLLGDRASKGYFINWSLSVCCFPSFRDKMKRRNTSDMLFSFNSILVRSEPSDVFAWNKNIILLEGLILRENKSVRLKTYSRASWQL